MEPIVRRAFTLIEVMISVALMAIFLMGELRVYNSLTRLRRQSEYASAARQAEIQLADLRKQAFDDLPPQILKPDAQGWIQLGQKDVEATSIRILPLRGAPQPVAPKVVTAGLGRVQVDPAWAGQPLLLDYAYRPCDRNETHRVPEHGLLTLDRGPAVRVEKVWLARGDELHPYGDWKITPAGLELGPTARGQVAVIDYRGENSVSRITGEFLDEQLRVQQAPSPVKRIQIESRYAGPERLRISLLKVQSP